MKKRILIRLLNIDSLKELQSILFYHFIRLNFLMWLYFHYSYNYDSSNRNNLFIFSFKRYNFPIQSKIKSIYFLLKTLDVFRPTKINLFIDKKEKKKKNSSY